MKFQYVALPLVVLLGLTGCGGGSSTPSDDSEFVVVIPELPEPELPLSDDPSQPLEGENVVCTTCQTMIRGLVGEILLAALLRIEIVSLTPELGCKLPKKVCVF